MAELITEYTGKDLKLSTPARLFCSGPSGCGKTTFVKQLLFNLEDVFDQPVANIIFCYAAEQPIYEELRKFYPKKITFVKGFPSTIDDLINNPKQHDLLILDDLIHELGESQFFLKLCTTFSHHWNCSLLAISQNLYFKSKYIRTCSLQATGMILFKTLRGKDQIQTLGRQLFPEKPFFLAEVYKEATKNEFAYLFLDLSATCPDALRVRNSIFPQKCILVFQT